MKRNKINEEWELNMLNDNQNFPGLLKFYLVSHTSLYNTGGCEGTA